MIVEHRGRRPQVGEQVYVAPTAVVIGDVVLDAQSSVWFGAVIRGDIGPIRVGARSSIQDNAVLHVNRRSPTIIGADVTVGHGAVLEGCRVEDGALIGMNATVLSGAVVGTGAVVAAGALVREGQQIPPETLAAGVPARLLGPLSETVRRRVAEAPAAYIEYARAHATNRRLD